MLETTLALTLHILGAVVWVGGMFAAYVCLRPAAGVLEGPQRLKLWRGFFAKFFPWVWVSLVLLLGSGYWMLLTAFGGFKGAPLYIHLMQGIGWLMVALFVWMFHGPWLKFKRAVDAQDWPAAGEQIELIRQIIMVNLPLGLIVVVIGGTGRFWGNGASAKRRRLSLRFRPHTGTRMEFRQRLFASLQALQIGFGKIDLNLSP
jgi:uncharacterized membrane protein